MARSRGEIPMGRRDSSLDDDQHIPKDLSSLTGDQSYVQLREVPSISPTMETSDRLTQRRSSSSTARRRGDSRKYTSNRPTDWSEDRPARDRSAIRSLDRSAYLSGDDSARDRPARDRSAIRSLDRSTYRSGDDSARDRPARDRSAVRSLDRSAYRSGDDSARDRPARDRSAIRSLDRSAYRSGDDSARDRPARDRSAVRSLDRSACHSGDDSARNRSTVQSLDRSAYRSEDDSAHEHTRCRDDLCDTHLSHSLEPRNRNTFRAPSDRSVRREEKRESEPGTGSERGRWESKHDQKRHHGGKTRYCLDGEHELRDKHAHTRVKSGEEDGGYQTGVSGLGKEAFGGGRRSKKWNDEFENGQEVNGVRQWDGGVLSVRDSGNETSRILGGTSWSGKSSADGSKLGHAADGPELRHASGGDDVEEQQLPSHLLGKKPEFKTSRGNVAKGIVFASDREEDPHRLSQRQKQIDFGKNTVGYDEYMRQVPIHKRRVGDPVTPDKGEKMSKRRWSGRIRKWRRQLHAYDKNPSPNETCNAPPDSDGPEESESGVSVAPITRDNCQEQERKEEPNVGIYDAEGALDDMFGVRQDMIGGADGERKRKRPESMEGILSKEDDGEEGNRDQSGDRDRPAIMRYRRGAWNGWGMSVKPLKLTKGEPLEHDKLSPTPKGCCIEQDKGTDEFTDMAVTNKDETKRGGFQSPECVTDGGMGKNARGALSSPIKRNLNSVNTGQLHQLRHLDRIDDSDGLSDPFHSGQAVTTEKAPTKPSEIDWDEIDFSDDDLL